MMQKSPAVYSVFCKGARELGSRPLLILLSLLMLPFSVHAQAWSGVLAPSRAIDWSKAGVPGGIPSGSWTQCGATIAPYGSSGSPASPAAINNAIAACAPNTYVQLGSGTFYLSSGILVSSHNNVEIRGMGANSTFIVFYGANSCQGVYADICFQSSDVNWNNGPSNGPVSVTGTLSKGSTTITLASVPNLQVGNPIILDQLDDTTDSGFVLVCSSTTSPVCSLQNNSGPERSGRQQNQYVTVTQCDGNSTIGHACSSGSNITISPGLWMPNWTSGKSPQAWWATNPILNVGIRNISLDHTASLTTPGSGAGIVFFNGLNGWVVGVRSIAASRAHVDAYESAHITVRDSYFFLARYSTSTSYGFECYGGSDDLVENNIFQAIAGALTISGGCSDVVLGYNFDIMNFYTSAAGWVMPMSNPHAVNDNILYEGNVGSSIAADVFHGTHNFDTVFRNYLAGNLPSCTNSPFGTGYLSATFAACSSDQIPIQLYSYSRMFNVIGNVLGQSGVQNGYQSGSAAIYSLGNGDTDPNTSVTVPSDPNVAATLMRWGNYDTVHAAVQWNSSEVPSGIAQFANAVPSSQALPASFYYGSKPSWWPSGKPWPAIGPDVSGGNIGGLAGHAYTNPAEDCYLNVMGGAANGTGGPYPFNAASCYSSSSTSNTQSVPTPPTDLSATVN